jgi:hypothetical protein
MTKLRTIHISTSDDDAGDAMLRRAAQYLWAGWTATRRGDTVLVQGYDKAGWTAEALVDRYWSGLIPAKVVR